MIKALKVQHFSQESLLIVFNPENLFILFLQSLLKTFLSLPYKTSARKKTKQNTDTLRSHRGMKNSDGKMRKEETKESEPSVSASWRQKYHRVKRENHTEHGNHPTTLSPGYI